MELAEDKQWRVRQAMIEYIPLLATQLGMDFFDDKLGNLCMSWMGDTVFSIREAATINMKKLTEVFGIEWARVMIIPRILAMGKHGNYMYRMTTVFAITVSVEAVYALARALALNPRSHQTIAPSLNVEIITDSVLDRTLELVVDPIPNIRFNVAKALETLAEVLMTTPQGREVAEQKLIPALKKLENDTDADVR